MASPLSGDEGCATCNKCPPPPAGFKVGALRSWLCLCSTVFRKWNEYLIVEMVRYLFICSQSPPKCGLNRPLLVRFHQRCQPLAKRNRAHMYPHHITTFTAPSFTLSSLHCPLLYKSEAAAGVYEATRWRFNTTLDQFPFLLPPWVRSVSLLPQFPPILGNILALL